MICNFISDSESGSVVGAVAATILAIHLKCGGHHNHTDNPAISFKYMTAITTERRYVTISRNGQILVRAGHKKKTNKLWLQSICPRLNENRFKSERLKGNFNNFNISRSKSCLPSPIYSSTPQAPLMENLLMLAVVLASIR